MVNAQVNKNANVCPNCGADLVLNPKTNNLFCSAKCWLNNPLQTQSNNGMYAQTDYYKGRPQQQKSFPKFDTQSAYTSYSKDVLGQLLSFQIELMKAGFIKDVKQLETSEALMEKSINMINEARNQFKQ